MRCVSTSKSFEFKFFILSQSSISVRSKFENQVIELRKHVRYDELLSVGRMATPFDLENFLAQEMNLSILLCSTIFQFKPTTALVKEIATET